jgi:hypothetical protein
MSEIDDILDPENRQKKSIVPRLVPSQHALSSEIQRTQKLIDELARRKSEALTLFEPLATQDSFFRSRTKERIYLGGNRAGKTLSGAVEFSRLVCGKDPYAKRGNQPVRAFIVGKSWSHLGKVIARKLFRPGAFKVIRDPDTGLWRAFRPLAPWDREHKDLRRDAEPLIPPRMIKTLSWENKKEFHVKDVVLTTGSEFTFLTCDSDKPQGWDADVAWFDEEIHGDQWYIETQMRLIDRNGIFFWTATPQSGTLDLYSLYERAERDEFAEKPTVSLFEMTTNDNPHLDEEGRAAVLASIDNEADYEVRILGKFAVHGVKIYPEFFPRGVHSSPVKEIPNTWTRYVAIDPGVQVCAALFAACPPPGTPYLPNGSVIIYDELYIKRCDAAKFAQAMKRKCQGITIHEWTMDYRQGRYTQATGKTYAQHYSDALSDRSIDISSERTGFNFVWSSDDIEAGIESVRKLLRIDPYGQPRLFVVTENVPALIKEMGRYSYVKRPSGEITDKPTPRVFHSCDALRYLCMREPSYKKPKKSPKSNKGTAVAILEAKKERAKMRKRATKGVGVSLGSSNTGDWDWL